MWEKDGFFWNKYDDDGGLIAIIVTIEVSDRMVYMGEFTPVTKIKAANYIGYLYTEDVNKLKLQMDLVLFKNGYSIKLPGF